MFFYNTASAQTEGQFECGGYQFNWETDGCFIRLILPQDPNVLSTSVTFNGETQVLGGSQFTAVLTAACNTTYNLHIEITGVETDVSVCDIPIIVSTCEGDNCCDISAYLDRVCARLDLNILRTDPIGGYPANSYHTYTVEYLDANGDAVHCDAVWNGTEVIFHLSNVNLYVTNSFKVTHFVKDLATDKTLTSCTIDVPVTSSVLGTYIGGLCNDLGTCTTTTLNEAISLGLLPPGSLNSNIDVIKNVYIRNLFVADVNYTFAHTNIGMGSNARIDVIVESNHGMPANINTLNFVDGVNISGGAHNCCMWQGIYVYGGAALQFNPVGNYAGPALGTNANGWAQNTVSDAIYTVRPMPNTPYQGVWFPNPVLRLNKTTFVNNFICMFSLNAVYTLREMDASNFLGGPFANICSTDGSCVLETTAQGVEFPFFADRGSYCGVLVINNQFPISTQMNFTVPAHQAILTNGSTNLFQNLPAGIVTRGISTNVSRCRFDHIVRGNYGDQVNIRNYGFAIQHIDGVGTQTRTLTVTGLGANNAIANNTFNFVESAVYAGAHKPNCRAIITNCRMDEVQRGIRIVSPNDTMGSVGNFIFARIQTNRINANHFHFPNIINVEDFSLHGIWVQDVEPTASVYQINRNNILIDVNNVDASGNPQDWGMANSAIGIMINAMDDNPNTVDDAGITTFVVSQNPIQLNLGQDAINLTNVQNGTVRLNTIRLQDKIGNAQDPAGVFSCGIQLNGGAHHALWNNTITDNTDGSLGLPLTNPDNTAIGIEVIGSPRGNFCTNTIRNTNQGLAFRGACEGSVVQANIFHAPMDQGLMYNGAWPSCNAGGAVTGPQIDLGNQWITTNGAFGIGAFYCGSDFFNSIYDVNLNAPFNPPSVFPNEDWFNTEDNPQNTTCQTIPFTGEGDEDEWIAQNPNAGGVTNWQLRRNLYDKLLLKPSLLVNNTSLQQFQSNFQNTAIGKLASVSQAIRQMTTQPLASAAALTQLQDQAAIKDSLFVLADSLWSQDFANNTLRQNRDLLANDLSTLVAQISTTYQSWLSERQVAAQQALVLTNTIAPTNNFEAAEKSVKAIFLQTILGNNPAANAAQIATLKSIAEDCYENVGAAKAAATSLYLQFTHQMPASNWDCNGANLNEPPLEDRGTQIVAKLNATIIPNPAASLVEIRLNVTDEVEITCVNIQGKLMTKSTAQAGQMQLDISTWSNGIYLVGINNGQTISYQKFVVQH